MIQQPAPNLSEPESSARAGAETDHRAWYLYGITRPDPGDAALLDQHRVDDRCRPPDVETGAAEPVVALRCGDLAVVVRRVRQTDFSPEALRERLADPVVLEAVVHHHHAVIAAIHEAQVILPGRFGCVYANIEDLVAAVSTARESLAHQLEQYAGCDEWAIHLNADPEAARQRVRVEDADARRLQQELSSAGPGRAYFLERKLQGLVSAGAQQTLDEAAQGAYDRLARSSVVGVVTPASRPADQAPSGVEILRAAFLVRRDNRDAFLDEVRSIARGPLGLECRYSGPWPPYSFARPVEAHP